MPEPITNEESLRLLRDFLRQVEHLLNELAEYPRPALPGRHHERMQAAWSAVRPNFQVAIKVLQTTDASNILPQLESHGLTGSQLVFKLAIFQHAHDELMDYGTPKDGQQKKRGWWRGWRNLFLPALKGADVVLGSLARVIPPLEAIEEYKESVELGVELGEAVNK